MLRRAALGLLTASPALFAQAPPPPAGPPVGRPTSVVAPAAAAPVAPAAPPALDPKLVAHLQAWEANMKMVDRFAVDARLTKTDLITKRNEEHTGTIWVMKPNLARLNIKRVPAANEKPNPLEFTAVVCTGKMLYQYSGLEKKVMEYELGPNGAGNNLLLDVMAGMTAQQLVNRFDVKLLQEDATYVYLEVKPRLPEDKADFEVMTLVLCGPAVRGRAYMPRVVELKRPNGQEMEKWDFPDPKVNPGGMDVKHFGYQEVPKDWRIERAVPKAAPLPQPPGGGNGPRIPVPGAVK